MKFKVNIAPNTPPMQAARMTIRMSIDRFMKAGFVLKILFNRKLTFLRQKSRFDIGRTPKFLREEHSSRQHHQNPAQDVFDALYSNTTSNRQILFILSKFLE
jgi:hypothetical protein